MVQERALAEKIRTFDLNREIGVARSQLAQLNAAQVSKQAELLPRRLSDLSVAVHFDVDSAMTAQRYRQHSRSEASQSIDGLTVRLVGHADPRGSETYNQRLSEARIIRGASASRWRCFTGDDSNGGRGEKQALADGRRDSTL